MQLRHLRLPLDHCLPSERTRRTGSGSARRSLSLGLVSISLLSGWLAASALAAELQAGLARTAITPANPVMLAGYASRKELSQGAHDPLFARAVAFEQNQERLVLVAVDNCGFYNATAEPLRRAVLTGRGLTVSLRNCFCARLTPTAPRR